ncbi:MAG TPA: AfsR/SARP family transcriptional regulator [Actinocrinis sp.]|nr:AfsR/SARP family transcriptional regulator [Actinocrinis sp.]
MRYELLGAIRLTEHDQEYPISSPKAAALLATLVIQAGRVVPTSQLLAELWPEAYPARAMGALHVYISQLRKLIRTPIEATSSIETCSPGYRLHTAGDQTDIALFWQDLANARTQLRSNTPHEALQTLNTALSRWRGPRALAGLRGGPLLNGFAAWTEESRLECLETRIEANLITHRHRETVGELIALIDSYPLRESFYKLLMLALYFSNRQADALHVYQRARNTVRTELGVEPCHSLRDLQQAILSSGPQLHDYLTHATTPAPNPVVSAAAPVTAPASAPAPATTLRHNGRPVRTSQHAKQPAPL